MPREAKLFSSSSGSAVRGFLKFRANIPPRWIKNARTSRKRVEAEIVRDLRTLKQVHQTHRSMDNKVSTQGQNLHACYNFWPVCAKLICACAAQFESATKFLYQPV